MRLDTSPRNSRFGRSVKDLEGFANYGRTIILSEVKSNTIPNILDQIFNFGVNGSDFISSNAKKTKVMVINHSQVYGSYHGLKDTRARNVHMHHGYMDCLLDEVNGSTPIRFVDMDFNVIIDRPSDLGSARTIHEIGDVKVSYDVALTGGSEIVRNTHNYTKNVLLPTPEYYDEKDMVLLGGQEENYGAHIDSLKENKYFTTNDEYNNEFYCLTLNELMDSKTRVFKLNITIDILTGGSIVYPNDFDNDECIQEIASELKYNLEKSGFSAAEIILSGRHGYNITNMRSYLELSPIERRFNFNMLCGAIDNLNDTIFEDLFTDYSLMLTFDYSNVHVNIISRLPINGITKTDSDVLELSQYLKTKDISSPWF